MTDTRLCILDSHAALRFISWHRTPQQGSDMTKANEKVLAMVRQELEKDPGVSNETLLTKAKKISRSVSRISPRQFHAMYRLQAARELAPAKPRKPRAERAKTPTLNRDAVRAVLLELATEVAAADQAGVVGVIGSLDRYVDRVVAA